MKIYFLKDAKAKKNKEIRNTDQRFNRGGRRENINDLERGVYTVFSA